MTTMSYRTDMFECKSYDFFNLKIWQFKIFNMTNDRTQVQLLAKLSDSEWMYMMQIFKQIYNKSNANFQTNPLQIFKQIQCKFSNKSVKLMQILKLVLAPQLRLLGLKEAEAGPEIIVLKKPV